MAIHLPSFPMLPYKIGAYEGRNYEKLVNSEKSVRRCFIKTAVLKTLKHF